jgi:hypothetical protein
MSSRFFCLAAFVAAGSVVAAAPSQASVIFSDLGPGGAYDSNVGWTVATNASVIAQDIAIGQEFTTTGAGDVSQIDVALGLLAGGGGAGQVSLWTSGFGSELGVWNATYSQPAGLFTISGITGVQLDADTTYILVASGLSDTFGYWAWNSAGATGNLYDNQSYQENGPLGAFDVLGGVAVPEPATWAMMLGGFGGLGALLRRRRARAAIAAG